jgi:hypothetical protein
MGRIMHWAKFLVTVIILGMAGCAHEPPKAYLDYAYDAIGRQDWQAAYRLMEDALADDGSDQQIRARALVERYPQIREAAQQTFSADRLKETARLNADLAWSIEKDRLEIYRRTIATPERYEWACGNYRAVFGARFAKEGGRPAADIPPSCGTWWPPASTRRERIAVIPASWSPVVAFQEDALKGVWGRIGKNAELGARITALPCDLCSAGACPPEVLAPCIGLLAVGASIGLVVGGGYELVTGGFLDDKSREQAGAHATDVGGRTQVVLNHQALSNCFLDAIKARRREGGHDWESNDRLAEISPAPAAAADAADPARASELLKGEGYDYVVQLALQRIVLVPASDSRKMERETHVSLKFEAGMTLEDLRSSRIVHIPAVFAVTDAKPIGAWAVGNGESTRKQLETACRVLATQMVDGVEKAWARQ